MVLKVICNYTSSSVNTVRMLKVCAICCFAMLVAIYVASCSHIWAVPFHVEIKMLTVKYRYKVQQTKKNFVG